MIRVNTVYASGAGASARYYTSYLAADDGEGEWLGQEAERLGLSGVVSTEDLEALLSGHDPTTGAQLGTRLVDRVDRDGKLIPAVAAYDVTASSVKDLSVVWGLTGDPGLLEAHDVAVRAVLAYIERYGATTRVRVNGDRQYPETGGLTRPWPRSDRRHPGRMILSCTPTWSSRRRCVWRTGVGWRWTLAS